MSIGPITYKGGQSPVSPQGSGLDTRGLYQHLVDINLVFYIVDWKHIILDVVRQIILKELYNWE